MGGAIPGSCINPALCYLVPAVFKDSQDGRRLTDMHAPGDHAPALATDVPGQSNTHADPSQTSSPCSGDNLKTTGNTQHNSVHSCLDFIPPAVSFLQVYPTYSKGKLLDVLSIWPPRRWFLANAWQAVISLMQRGCLWTRGYRSFSNFRENSNETAQTLASPKGAPGSLASIVWDDWIAMGHTPAEHGVVCAWTTWCWEL